MSSLCTEHVVLLEHHGARWAARSRWKPDSVWREQVNDAPLSACATLLEQAPRGRLRWFDQATVLLGFPHVHYLMLPWQAGLYKAADWQGLAELAFSQQAGFDMQQWQVHIASAGFGVSRIAVAVRRDLLNDLRALFKLKGLTLSTCAPLLTATLQHYWHQLPKDCVLAVPEATALSCLYLQQGTPVQVCAVRTHTDTPLSDSLFAAQLLVQVRASAVCVASVVPLHDDPWMGPPHPWLQELEN